MNIYITELQALSPITGELTLYEGVRICASSEKQAQNFLNDHGYGYCRVVGKLIDVDFYQYEFSKN